MGVSLFNVFSTLTEMKFVRAKPALNQLQPLVTIVPAFLTKWSLDLVQATPRSHFFGFQRRFKGMA